MGEALDRVRSACESRGLTIKPAGKWFRCQHPCSPEGDTSRSFAFLEEPDGKVNIRSHKPTHSAEDCLRALGLQWLDLYPPKDGRVLGKYSGREIVRRYEYTDHNGRALGAVCRTDTKEFPSGHYDRDGSWKWGVPADKKLPLYRLPMVTEAIKEGRTIYVVEGEKDADAMWKYGYAATTKPGGAGSPWLPEHVEALAGADLVVVADKDAAGEKCGRESYKALLPVAKSVCVVQAADGVTLEGFPLKDPHDHLAAGFGVDDFVPRSDLHGSSALPLISYNGKFEMVDVDYLVKPQFPLGRTMFFDADGGVGKTSVLLALFASFSNGLCPVGEYCPDGPTKSILVYADEDDPEAYYTVYKANGGKDGFFALVDGRRLVYDSEFADSLKSTIRSFGASIVAVDPFFSMIMPLLGQMRTTINDADAASKIMPMVSSVSTETGCLQVLVRHTGKTGVPGKALSDAGLGSTMWRALARGQIVARWHPDEPGVAMISDEKGSILVPRGEDWFYRKTGNFGQVEFIKNMAPPSPRSSSKSRVNIPDWLVSVVPCDSWVPVASIVESAKVDGIPTSGGAWTRAKSDTCISRKMGEVWYMTLKHDFAPNGYNPVLDE